MRPFNNKKFTQDLEISQKIKREQRLKYHYKNINNKNSITQLVHLDCDDREVIKCFAVKMEPSLANSYIATPSIGFNGSQLLPLYNIPSVIPKITPSGTMARKVKIAIIVAYTSPNLKSDLNNYWTSPANFGPDSNPPNVTVYTMPGASINRTWSDETCIDVQMVCTINPNADIYVVEAVNGMLPNMLAAIEYAEKNFGVDIISMSWGGNESVSFLKHSSRFNNSKICYCAATGDNNFVSWPATLANCVAVGGTTLLWNPNKNFQLNRTEYTWPLAGCGFSNIIDKPSYQNSVNSSKKRTVPDISLVANPQNGVYIISNGQWSCMGGTSLATPIFAGMLSIANQQRFNAGKDALTTVYSDNQQNNVQSCLYNLHNLGSYNSIFTDIVLGTDAGTNGNMLQVFNTGIKYDIPTGLGSPNCEEMCNKLLNL